MQAEINVSTTQVKRILEYEGVIVVSIKEMGIKREFRFRVINPFQTEFVLTFWKGKELFLELKGGTSAKQLNGCNNGQRAVSSFFTDCIVAGIIAFYNKYNTDCSFRFHYELASFMKEKIGIEMPISNTMSQVMEISEESQESFYAACR